MTDLDLSLDLDVGSDSEINLDLLDFDGNSLSQIDSEKLSKFRIIVGDEDEFNLDLDGDGEIDLDLDLDLEFDTVGEPIVADAPRRQRNISPGVSLRNYSEIMSNFRQYVYSIVKEISASKTSDNNFTDFVRRNIEPTRIKLSMLRHIVSWIENEYTVVDIINALQEANALVPEPYLSELRSSLMICIKRFESIKIASEANPTSYSPNLEMSWEAINEIEQSLKLLYDRFRTDDGKLNIDATDAVEARNVDLSLNTFVCGNCEGTMNYTDSFVKFYLSYSTQKSNVLNIVPHFEMCDNCGEINVMSQRNFYKLRDELMNRYDKISDTTSALSVFVESVSKLHAGIWLYRYAVPNSVLCDILPSFYVDSSRDDSDKADNVEFDYSSMIAMYLEKVKVYSASSAIASRKDIITFGNSGDGSPSFEINPEFHCDFIRDIGKIFCSLGGYDYVEVKDSALQSLLRYLVNNFGVFFDVETEYETNLQRYMSEDVVDIGKEKDSVLTVLENNVGVLGLIPIQVHSEISFSIYNQLLPDKRLANVCDRISDVMVLNFVKQVVHNFDQCNVKQIWGGSSLPYDKRFDLYLKELRGIVGAVDIYSFSVVGGYMLYPMLYGCRNDYSKVCLAFKNRDFNLFVTEALTLGRSDTFLNVVSESFDAVNSIIDLSVLDSKYGEVTNVKDDSNGFFQQLERLLASESAPSKDKTDRFFLSNMTLYSKLLIANILSKQTIGELLKYDVVYVSAVFGFKAFMLVHRLESYLVQSVLANCGFWEFPKNDSGVMSFEEYVLIHYPYRNTALYDIINVYAPDAEPLTNAMKFAMLASPSTLPLVEKEFEGVNKRLCSTILDFLQDYVGVFVE
jgi:hypothetical protein